MCIGEGGFLGLFVGSWRMRNLWLYICSGGDPVSMGKRLGVGRGISLCKCVVGEDTKTHVFLG